MPYSEAGRAGDLISGTGVAADVFGTSAESVADDLRRYGENDTAAWLMTCTDDEFVRVCSVADWLIHYGPTSRSGSSMMIAKACALAAVYVREGRPRELARRVRMAAEPGQQRIEPRSERWPNFEMQCAAPRHYGVGDDAREYWASS